MDTPFQSPVKYLCAHANVHTARTAIHRCPALKRTAHTTQTRERNQRSTVRTHIAYAARGQLSRGGPSAPFMAGARRPQNVDGARRKRAPRAGKGGSGVLRQAIYDLALPHVRAGRASSSSVLKQENDIGIHFRTALAPPWRCLRRGPNKTAWNSHRSCLCISS